MRTSARYLGGLALAASVAFAAVPADPAPVYLSGYYKLYDWYSVWQYSDRSPWYVVPGAAWADPRLVKWGYVPVTHASQNYYCLIERSARTGSNILERTFTCGDPATVEMFYRFNRGPTALLYGGH